MSSILANGTVFNFGIVTLIHTNDPMDNEQKVKRFIATKWTVQSSTWTKFK